MKKTPHLSETKFEFLCEYRTYNPDTDMPFSHYHRFYEILYVLDGSRKIVFENGEEHILDPSSIALIQPGVSHRTFSNSDQKQSKIVIMASEQFVEILTRTFSRDLLRCFDHGVIHMDRDTQQTIYRNLVLLRQRYDSVNFYADDNKLLFLNIVYALTRSIEEVDAQKQKSMDVVFEVKKYIDLHFSQDLRLSELANRFSVSVSHLSREFKKKTGYNVSEYIARVRLTHARRLLEGSTMSIMEVAENVGFSSLNHFDKMFKKDHGMTPTQYKQCHITGREKPKSNKIKNCVIEP